MNAAVVALLALIAVAAIIGILWTVYRQEHLDEREKELEQISIDLDGRANRIAAEEETIKSEWAALRQARKAVIMEKMR